jgi:FkbM family methyltransferase
MSLKQLVKQSPPYASLRRWRQASSLRDWLPEDQTRLEFYSRFIRAQDLVFDVGANVGNRSKVFLRMGARVVAFEPQAACADLLQRVLAKNPSFHLVRKALGDKPGLAEMQISDSHVLSTLSSRWIAATSASGRFKDKSWDACQQVQVTTLDHAVAEYGVPAFTKIDVEGYETEVLSGLHAPLPCGSIEFATEDLDGMAQCLSKLNRMQTCHFQFSAAETMDFAWPRWLRLDEALTTLGGLAGSDPRAWGDVYFATDSFARDRCLQ